MEAKQIEILAALGADFTALADLERKKSEVKATFDALSSDSFEVNSRISGSLREILGAFQEFDHTPLKEVPPAPAEKTKRRGQKAKDKLTEQPEITVNVTEASGEMRPCSHLVDGKCELPEDETDCGGRADCADLALEPVKDVLTGTASGVYRPDDVAEESAPLPDDAPTICANKDCIEHDPKQPNGCKVCENVYECGEVVAAAAPQEVQEQPEPAGAPQETAAEEQADLFGTKETSAEAQAEAAPAGQALPDYQPLDDPVGNCEICHGYGVVDGELYGEVTLLPCTCEAGDKVMEPHLITCNACSEAGGAGLPVRHLPPACPSDLAEEELRAKGGDVTAGSACNDCHIDNPDCASCHMPDMDAASPVELPAEEQARRDKYCGAWRDKCEPATADKCFSGIGCAILCTKNDPNKRVIPAANSEQPEQVEQPAPDPAPEAQKKPCPHPQPFRAKNDKGETYCKVCKVIIAPAQAAA